MKYLQGWDQLDGNLTRLGNELGNTLIIKDGIKWDSGDWWRTPKWSENAKKLADELLSPTKELDDILSPQMKENPLVVVQVRWGNHRPGASSHFPTPAFKFRDVLDMWLPRWGKPKVYLASDCVDEVLKYFDKYDIIHWKMFEGVKDACIIDYWMMVNCHKLICSNSSLPWCAALINKKCDFFIRPNANDRLVIFEPWKSSPCVILDPLDIKQNLQDFRDQIQ